MSEVEDACLYDDGINEAEYIHREEEDERKALSAGEEEDGLSVKKRIEEVEGRHGILVKERKDRVLMKRSRDVVVEPVLSAVLHYKALCLFSCSEIFTIRKKHIQL